MRRHGCGISNAVGDAAARFLWTCHVCRLYVSVEYGTYWGWFDCGQRIGQSWRVLWLGYGMIDYAVYKLCDVSCVWHGAMAQTIRIPQAINLDLCDDPCRCGDASRRMDYRIHITEYHIHIVGLVWRPSPIGIDATAMTCCILVLSWFDF